MSKVVFLPCSVLGGVLARLIGKKAFEGLWGGFDDEEAPKPEGGKKQKKEEAEEK